MKGYIAGKLFKEADIKQRKYEKEKLQEKLPGVHFHNPIDDPEANDKSQNPTAQTIFLNDTRHIIESDIIIAELDDEDPGVMMELGIAYGINYILNLLKSGVKAEEILNTVPVKKIFAHCSDIRMSTAGQYDGRYIPFGLNQYVVGGIEEMGKIYSSFEEILKILSE